MTNAGIPVPPGFVITAGAFREAIEELSKAKKNYLTNCTKRITFINGPLQLV
jgi:phosphoenolpyruvate synthase/pyruvate phosphate dikinase